MKHYSKAALRTLEGQEDEFMLACGWRPVDEAHPENEWTPPEDRENRWDRERALEECKWRCVRPKETT